MRMMCIKLWDLYSIHPQEYIIKCHVSTHLETHDTNNITCTSQSKLCMELLEYTLTLIIRKANDTTHGQLCTGDEPIYKNNASTL